MQKNLITEKILQRLRMLEAEARRNYEEHHEESKRAPSAMESHSDTSRFQMAKLAEDALYRAEQIKKVIEILDQDIFKNLDEPGTGSIIETEENGQKIFYFLVPEGAGGMAFESEGFNIKAIAARSPLGTALIKNRMNSSFEFETPKGKRKIKILNLS